MTESWGKKLGKGLFEGGKKLGTEILKAGKAAAEQIADQKAAMDERQLTQLREQIRAKLAIAETYRHNLKVAQALDAFPPNWNGFELAPTRELSRGKCMVALDSAVDAARDAADRAAREASAEHERHARIERIPALFADRGNELTLSLDEMYIRTEGQSEAARGAWYLAVRGIPRQLEFARLVADFDDVQHNLLKTWMLLHAHGILSDFAYYALYIPIIYNDGQCRRYVADNAPLPGAEWERFKEHMGRTSMSAAEAWERMRAEILDAEQMTEDPVVQDLLHDALYGGNSWMRVGELNKTGFFIDHITPTSLILGPLADAEKLVSEDGEGSLLTVAPPGTGKMLIAAEI
ncbi:hypothetical protein [Tepidicaulis sp.]|uniref:hypothetical protein n=1 Tax=Tepidicaulis sp. TaxID=1920809 RepID=UPI003B5C402D